LEGDGRAARGGGHPVVHEECVELGNGRPVDQETRNQ
jgi:hypothetical protein